MFLAEELLYASTLFEPMCILVKLVSVLECKNNQPSSSKSWLAPGLGVGWPHIQLLSFVLAANCCFPGCWLVIWELRNGKNDPPTTTSLSPETFALTMNTDSAGQSKTGYIEVAFVSSFPAHTSCLSFTCSRTHTHTLFLWQHYWQSVRDAGIPYWCKSLLLFYFCTRERALSWHYILQRTDFERLSSLWSS